MFRMDTSETSKLMPIYQIKKSKDLKFNDFDFLNSDSIVAMSSLKPKHTWIFDTLVPQKNGLVMENTIGGNIILPYRDKN
jgi:hypothetical protein